MSIIHITNPDLPSDKLLDGYFNNIDTETINGSTIPIFSDVVVDSIDSSFNVDSVIVGSTGGLSVRQTPVTIDQIGEVSGVDVLNAESIDVNSIYSLSGEIDYIDSLDIGTQRLGIVNPSNNISSVFTAPSITTTKAVSIPDLSGTMALSGAGQTVSFGNSTVSSLTTPSITSSSSLSISSASNQNLNLDAQGTGLINLNTVQSYGVVVNTNATTNLGFAVRNASQPFLAMGYLTAGAEVQPTIAGLQGTGLSYSNMTLRDKVLISNTGFSYAYLSDCLLGVGGNIKCSGIVKTDSIQPQSTTGTISVPNITGTMAVSGANQTVSFGNITSSTNIINGITIPASGGTLAKTSDIVSYQKFMAFRVNADTSIAYKSTGPTLTFSTSSGTGVYNVFIEAGYIIRSITANSMLAGGARIVNVERVSDTNFMLICRTVAEVGTDSAFSGCVYYD